MMSPHLVRSPVAANLLHGRAVPENQGIEASVESETVLTADPIPGREEHACSGSPVEADRPVRGDSFLRALRRFCRSGRWSARRSVSYRPSDSDGLPARRLWQVWSDCGR